MCSFLFFFGLETALRLHVSSVVSSVFIMVFIAFGCVHYIVFQRVHRFPMGFIDSSSMVLLIDLFTA